VTSTYRIIGKPIGRPDGVDKVTGAGRYSAGQPVPGSRSLSLNVVGRGGPSLR
jgi:hypothetical protein